MSRQIDLVALGRGRRGLGAQPAPPPAAALILTTGAGSDISQYHRRSRSRVFGTSVSERRAATSV